MTFLVLFTILHLLVAYDCPDTLITDATYTCSTAATARTYDTTFLTKLSPGITQMTVSFDIMIKDWCGIAPTTNPYYFVMSITPSGDTEKLLGKVAWLASSSLMRMQTEDTTGTHLVIQGGSFPAALNVWISYSFSFDLAGTKVTRGGARSATSKFTNTYTGNYGSWTIDSTLKFYLCMDSATSNVFGCEISNFKISYPYYNNQNNLIYGNAPVLIGDFRFDDTQTQYSVQDHSNQMGTAYLGTSSGDQTGAPTWLSALNGVQFTESTYVTLPTFTIKPLINYPATLSLSVNMWIKVDSYPASGNNYIFRYSSSDLSTDKFAVQITSTGLISMTASDATATTSTQTVPTSTWTSINIVFTYTYTNNGYATIQIGTNTAKVASISTISALTFDGSEKVRVGGFKGALTNLKVLSPAGHLYNTPSCSSTCYMDLGNNNPAQCIIEKTCLNNEVCLSDQSCPDGTYNSGGTCPDCKTGCKTCTGPGATCGSCKNGYSLENSDCMAILQQQSGGLSKGVLAIIVVGGLAFLAIFSAFICFFFLKRRKSRSKNRIHVSTETVKIFPSIPTDSIKTEA